MKKILLLFLFVSVGLSSWANDKMCADTTGIGGGSGLHCPKPNNPPVSYYIDADTGIVHVSTASLEQIRVQIVGQVSGLVYDELFYGHASFVLYNCDFYEIRFIIHSVMTYIDYFYL